MHNSGILKRQYWANQKNKELWKHEKKVIDTGGCQCRLPNLHLPNTMKRCGFRENHESSKLFDSKCREDSTKRVRQQACDSFLEIVHTYWARNMPKHGLGVSQWQDILGYRQYHDITCTHYLLYGYKQLHTSNGDMLLVSNLEASRYASEQHKLFSFPGRGVNLGAN